MESEQGTLLNVNSVTDKMTMTITVTMPHILCKSLGRKKCDKILPFVANTE